MVETDRTVMFNSLLFSLLLCSSWIQFSYCSKPVGVARRDDIPFIKCQVCEKIAKELHEQAKISPKKISENDVTEMLKIVCNLKKNEADWILKIDIVKQGDNRLKLVAQDSKGQCGSKCKTIERACQEVIGDHVVRYIYENKPTLKFLVNFLCKDTTKACSTMPPPVPKGKILTEKESNSKKLDWMQNFTKGVKNGIKNGVEATKKFATDVFSESREWYEKKKATFTQQKSKSGKVEL